jgi:thiamine kinase-like enzyme
VNRPRNPADVIERLPGWSGAVYQAMDGGSTARTWLLEQEGRRAVLKLDTGPRDPALNSRPAEAAIQRSAHAAGLAPAVLFAAEGILLSDYVSGPALDAGAGGVRAPVERLATDLRRLHALPTTGRAFDAVAAARRYADAALRRNVDARLVRHCLAEVQDMPLPEDRRCCHNDLVADNIIAGESTCFIDWEYACDNDPMFDLATIACEHRLSGEQVGWLLGAYFEDRAAERRPALERHCRAYAALARLWRLSR